jgi:hypothetical protein
VAARNATGVSIARRMHQYQTARHHQRQNFQRSIPVMPWPDNALRCHPASYLWRILPCIAIGPINVACGRESVKSLKAYRDSYFKTAGRRGRDAGSSRVDNYQVTPGDARLSNISTIKGFLSVQANLEINDHGRRLTFLSFILSEVRNVIRLKAGIMRARNVNYLHRMKYSHHELLILRNCGRKKLIAALIIFVR